MRAFAALRSPDFLRILSAQTLGRVSKYLARSALAVGLFAASASVDLLAAQALASLLFAALAVPLTGSAISHVSRRTVLFTVLGSGAALTAASAVFGALGGNAIAIYFFVAIVVAGATASAGVILQQLETDTVPEQARRSAIGLSAWTNGIPKLFGLCFGAAIAVALPFEIVISVVAALFLGSLVACLRVNINQRRPSGRNPWRDLAAGFKYCVHASDQRAALIAAALTLAVVTPLEFLMPSVAANSDSNTTLLLAALALGGLAGGLAVASSEDRSLKRYSMAGLVVAVAALGCLAIVSHQVISLIAIAVVGFAWEGVWGLTRCRVQLGMSAQKGAVALRFLTFGIKIVGGVAVVVYALAESTFSHQTMLAALTVTLLAAGVALGIQRTRA